MTSCTYRLTRHVTSCTERVTLHIFYPRGVERELLYRIHAPPPSRFGQNPTGNNCLDLGFGLTSRNIKGYIAVSKVIELGKYSTIDRPHMRSSCEFTKAMRGKRIQFRMFSYDYSI